MKIYNFTEYIEKPKVGDLKLKVNSMSDFKSRSVCFEDIKKSFGSGNETISYDLEECIEVKEGIIIGGTKKCKNTKWKQAEINYSIKEELIKKGYILSIQYQTEEIAGYKCTVCGHIWSKLEADLIKFDLCNCGNIFKDNANWDIVYKKQ